MGQRLSSLLYFTHISAAFRVSDDFDARGRRAVVARDQQLSLHLATVRAKGGCVGLTARDLAVKNCGDAPLALFCRLGRVCKAVILDFPLCLREVTSLVGCLRIDS